MTIADQLVTIAAPLITIVAVILTWLHNRTRLERIEVLANGRFQRLQAENEALKAELDAVQQVLLDHQAEMRALAQGTSRAAETATE